MPKSLATRSHDSPLVSEAPRSVLDNAPHCLRCFTLLLELFGMLHHLVGLLLRVLNAQMTGTKPVQVHIMLSGRTRCCSEFGHPDGPTLLPDAAGHLVTVAHRALWVTEDLIANLALGMNR